MIYFNHTIFLFTLILIEPIAFLKATTPERVQIRVDQPIIVSKGNFNLYCKVPRHPDNRKLTLEAYMYRSRTEDLKGVNAMVIFGLLIQEVECMGGIVDVLCKLETSKNETFIAKSQVEVRGCS